jgi:heme A synthase
MATKKQGILTTSGEWWQHLRWTKRLFWKRARKAARKDAASRRDNYDPPRMAWCALLSGSVIMPGALSRTVLGSCAVARRWPKCCGSVTPVPSVSGAVL